ncbi:transporter [Streptomyces cinnamoneus]|uniref:Transporter n=1 Tax=Streptomyces cinnamoneus TaxID=53446 RepID=A0A2G1XC86_STRCJ|nr:transporter [Streptomyces cinnamoneus]PHQ48811.1 transporter [Streptomyces cinnamoneus]PPT14542.1 transporter [Streptomyces cinnamoneus]
MSAPAPTLLATFVRLKLSLLRNGLRQSSGRRAVFVTAIVLTGLFAALQFLGLWALRGEEHAAALTVPLAALTALGWAFVPLFFPGGDETLDASKLVMLPLRTTPLVVALLAASLVGIGPAFTLVLFLGSVVATAHGAAAWAVGLPASVMALLLCLALARAVATANVRLLTSRKGKEMALLSGVIIAVGMQLVNLGMSKVNAVGGLARLEPAADVLRWVPPGSALDAVRAAGEGAYGQAAAELALTAAVLAAVLWWWQRGLTKVMTSGDASTLPAASPAGKGGSRAGATGGLPGWLPPGRPGAVVFRSLRYIGRDPKTRMAWTSALLVGLVVPAVNAAQGNASVYWSFFAATMLGMQTYNQFGQDGSAFWMVLQTIASPRDAYLELRSRTVALAVIAVPYVTLVALVSAAIAGDWRALPTVWGLCLALVGALFATGALASTHYPYSVPQEGAFKNVAPGQGGIAWMSLFLGALVSAALCAPVVGLAVWLHSLGSAAALWALVPVGAAYGLSVTWAGLRVAAPRTAARLPEILAAVNKG